MKYIIVFIVLITYTLLFKKAAGTLKPNIMNVITFIFFSILGFELIGGSLVFLGFNDHYLIQKVSNKDTINKTYYILAYTALMLPLAIILANKYIFKIDKTKKNGETLKNKYIDKLKEKVDIGNKELINKMFICMVILTLICLMSIMYVFKCIGYMPFLKYFDSSMNLDIERIKVSRNFNGNEYIKNLIMLTITPLISYITYIYMSITKEKRWKILFIVLLILNLLALTYNFEKAPFIYYLLFFYIIKVILGGTFKFQKIIPIICICIIIVFILYRGIFGYRGPLISVSSGPVSRILITQVATLFLHIDAFPDRIEYIGGHSFPKVLVPFLGEGDYDIRSARLVMELYNRQAVKKGTAGVMNALFVGEAYANFGIVGVLIAPILLGIIFSAIIAWFIKSKKNPINIVIYVQAFSLFTGALQGGFVEFFYNIKFIEIIILMCLINFAIKKCEFLWRDIKLKI